MINPFLIGERVYLRPLCESDCDGPYPSWFNDEEVCRGNSHHTFPYGVGAAVEHVRRVAQSRDCVVLAIVLREDDRHVGNIALQEINWVNRSAEFAILIGDRTAWGNGYGRDAARLLLDHGFNALNLHRVHCGTFEDNETMQRLALYLGMREEGRRREAAFKDGRYVDILEFGVLGNEYAAHWQGEGTA